MEEVWFVGMIRIERLSGAALAISIDTDMCERSANFKV